MADCTARRSTTCARPRAPRPPRPASVAVRAPRARPPVAVPRAPRPATRSRPRFEGGQMPLHMRLPKLKGFKNRVPGRVPGRQPGQARRAVPRGRRRSPSTTWSPRARSARASWSRCSATASSSVALAGDRARVLRLRQGEDRGGRRLRHRARERSSRARLGQAGVACQACTRRSARPDGLPVCRGQAATAARRLAFAHASGSSPQRADRPAGGARAHRVRHGRSGRRTCARSCCSRSRIIALFRLGSHDPDAGRRLRERPRLPRPGQRRSAASIGLVNLFSGGALLQLSVFALGIMPYITASIILQLLTVVIPRLETLRRRARPARRRSPSTPAT